MRRFSPLPNGTCIAADSFAAQAEFERAFYPLLAPPTLRCESQRQFASAITISEARHSRSEGEN
jgi:hypothetical protein